MPCAPTWPCLAVAAAGTVRHAAVAIANPVTGDMVRMTNHHWEFSIEALRRELGFEIFVVVNDFRHWRCPCRTWLSTKNNRSAAAPRSGCEPIGLVGAGTGLGVSGLIPGLTATAGPRCAAKAAT
jgi:glucokinase